MPPLDVALAKAPAQPDLAAGDEGREVDEAGLDLAERHAQLVDPGDAGLHLVDHALHPEAEPPALRSALAGSSGGIVGGALGRGVAGCRLEGCPAGELVAQGDQLGPLVAERLEDRPELRDRLVGFIEVEEPGHPANSIRAGARARRGASSRAMLARTMRSILLWMARNQWLRERLPKLWFARRAVRRFMPGEDADSALAAAAGFAADGIAVMFTRLGENVTKAEEGDAVAEHYLGLLDTIAERAIDGEVSVKLTQLGYDIDRDRTLAHCERLAEKAAAQGRTLWVDMEGSDYVDGTLELYERLHAAHPNTGICLQAYLHRTAADIQRLLPQNPGVRLVKGAYAEKATVAYQKRPEVDANYVALAVAMLEGMRAGHTVTLGLGTHDVELIEQIAEHAVALGLDRTAFEVEMLYGIRSGEQRRLAKAGYRVRDLIAYGEAWYPWYMRRLAERPANVLFALRQLLP